jgi:hypothetical protein
LPAERDRARSAKSPNLDDAGSMKAEPVPELPPSKE